MTRFPSPRGAQLAVPLVFALGLVSRALAAQPGILPVYRSPIDITGEPLMLKAMAPDRETGQLVDVKVPLVPGPVLKRLTDMPMSDAMDAFWDRTPSIEHDGARLTPRQAACDGPQGLRKRLPRDAYDLTCRFASKGRLVGQKDGALLTLGYQLDNNEVWFYARTPATCHRNHPSFLCPDDPKVHVRFDVAVITKLQPAGLCRIYGGPPQVVLNRVRIDSGNLSADVIKGLINVIKPSLLPSFERAIAGMAPQPSMPIDAGFKELGSSVACTDPGHPVARAVALFPDVETRLADPRGLTIRLLHRPIPAPALSELSSRPEAGGFSSHSISAPPFARPGETVRIVGRSFPVARDLAALWLSATRDNSPDCRIGWSELEWGPAGGPVKVDKVACPDPNPPAGLQPATAYRFRLRDCDPFTCSAFSRPVQATTRQAQGGADKVALTLDGKVDLGTVGIDQSGNFQSDVVIPPATAPGTHTLLAIMPANDRIGAQLDLRVTAAGDKAKAVLTSRSDGDKGCPTNALPDNVNGLTTDHSFTLFGTGFEPGTAAVRLDSESGVHLGTAAVQQDGSFCGEFNGPPDSHLGDHNLVVMQNGSKQVSIPVKVYRPAPVR